jgi:hypothetical protein
MLFFSFTFFASRGLFFVQRTPDLILRDVGEEHLDPVQARIPLHQFLSGNKISLITHVPP